MGTSANEQAPGAGASDGSSNAPGAGGTGGGENAGGAGGSGTQNPGSPGLDRSKLNPILAGMNEQQINETMDTLLAAVRRPIPPERPVELPPKKEMTVAEMKDRFDPLSDKFDPPGAVRDMVEANYGGLITDINKKANEGLYGVVRKQMPGFEEHEADVREVLKDLPPHLLNQQSIANTYFSVVGAKEVAKKLKDQQRAPTTREPSVIREESEQKLSAEEEQVARVMFRSSADPIADYKKTQKMVEEGYTVKVPGVK